MNREAVVRKLRRSIGLEGRALLHSFNLFEPLVHEMLAAEAISGVAVSEEELEHAQLGLLRQRGYDGMHQWGELLESLGISEEELLERLRNTNRRLSFIQKRFAAKAESRFMDRKNELDQVVYSLLRLKNSFLARELYLQIESGESNFADLAKRYAEGRERNTNGIIGPVSLTEAHPALAEKLRVAQAGVVLEPFRIADWWLVVRLERYSPAKFTDEVSKQMCQEMFNAWIDQETAAVLTEINGLDDYSDFSIS